MVRPRAISRAAESPYPSKTDGWDDRRRFAARVDDRRAGDAVLRGAAFPRLAVLAFVAWSCALALVDVWLVVVMCRLLF
jgi:hypothetical protein